MHEDAEVVKGDVGGERDGSLLYICNHCRVVSEALVYAGAGASVDDDAPKH